MMDGCILLDFYWTIEYQQPFSAIIKLERARTFLISFWLYLKEESHIHFSSTSAPLLCGVLQGSILGPLLFSLYMLPLGTMFQKYSISYHCYADDLQFYFPVSLGESCSLEKVHECYTDIKLWLFNNFLQLNESKTEV